jgi:uncharacterized protein YkwD
MKLITCCYLLSFTLAQLPEVGKGMCYLANKPHSSGVIVGSAPQAPAPPPPPQAPAPAPAPPPAPPASQEIQDCLNAHNNARNAKGVSNLVWNSQLAADSVAYSARLYGQKSLTHSGGPYGENLYSTSGTGNCVKAVAAWMAEEADYLRLGPTITSTNFHAIG